MRILIVEDDDNMRLGLTDLLHAEGYTVKSAADGVAGLELAATARFDAVVLDVMLPGVDGLALCRELRARAILTPVLMLTARAWIAQRVEGLDAGADDYLVKPFSREELLARLRALLRRATTATARRSTMRLGKIRVDFEKGTATLDDRRLELSARELRVLEVLAAAEGKPLTREEILDRAWPPGAAPTMRTIDNHILSLRNRIEPDPSDPKHLLTVHRVGYRLDGAEFTAS